MLAASVSTHTDVATWPAGREAAYALGTSIAQRHRQLEWTELGHAAGRTVERDLRSLMPLPGFDLAAMDGWAVGGGVGPWKLDAPILAGSAIPSARLQASRASPIATGAPLPSGAVAVLRRESGTVDAAGLLHALAPVTPGTDIRRAGEEAQCGDLLLRAGQILTPARLALLAAAGYDSVPTRSRPRTTVVVMGDEICRSGTPAPGMVRDVFGAALTVMLSQLGFADATAVSCPDTLPTTTGILELGMAENALVITTGGSSRGPADHARAALGALGASPAFDGIDMRPGHPVMLHEGSGSAVLSLPGNPLAGFIAFLSFAPALSAGLFNRSLPVLRQESIREPIENTRRSTRLVPCRSDGDGLRPAGWSGSGMLRGLADADVVAVVPAGGVRTGESCQVLPTGGFGL